jgi:hypothetical protein
MAAYPGTMGTFDIPSRPDREYPHSGGVTYTGETVFALTPAASLSDREVTDLLERVLADSDYTYGDWFDLPMPLYLVHDERTGDVFRVAVRDGTVELHVLPETESDGLEGIYDRLVEVGDTDWDVDCRTDG